jgi:hypothetical protein
LSVILACLDCHGRSIVLLESCWNDHIVRDHPELEPLLISLEIVLTNPYRIYQDSLNAARENFYRAGLFPERPQRLVKVCVDFRQSESGHVIGEVVTAYAATRMKPSEKLKWPILI